MIRYTTGCSGGAPQYRMQTNFSASTAELKDTLCADANARRAAEAEAQGATDPADPTGGAEGSWAVESCRLRQVANPFNTGCYPCNTPPHYVVGSELMHKST